MDRSRRRFPEGHRRGSGTPIVDTRSSPTRRLAPSSDSSLQAGAGSLIEDAVRASMAGETRDDDTFGAFSTLLGFFRSAAMQEGLLIEAAIRHTIETHPGLRLLPARAMPVVPGALDMLKRTAPHLVGAIRFPLSTHTTESYRPDLFVANPARHTALIIDVKRRLLAHRPADIDRLRIRMLAAASIAPEWVLEQRGPALSEIETAIVDGADEVSDHGRGVFKISELDGLLEVSGAAAFVSRVRAEFAQRIQTELRHRCGILAPWAKAGDEHDRVDQDIREVDVKPSSCAAPPLLADRPRRFGFARRPSLH